MSDSRLYRIKSDTPVPETMLLFALYEDGWLVPVDPCEHGNYDRHFVKNPYSTLTGKWCPGAAVGEET